MNIAHDLLEQLQLNGATRFANTDLAHSHAGLTRRVRRDRAVRMSVMSVAGVAIVGAAAVTIAHVANDPSAPAGTPATPTFASPVPSASSVTLSVGEQESTSDVVAHVATALGVSESEVDTALVSALPAEANGDYDGWILAGDYGLKADSTPAEAAQLLIGTTAMQLGDMGVPPEKWRDTVVLASIVQAEAPVFTDQASVARVLVNRLDAGMPLQLQSAPGSDSQPGLLAGGIGAPSPHALEAAAHPAKGDWLFFLRKEDGNVLLFTTYEDFQTAVLARTEVRPQICAAAMRASRRSAKLLRRSSCASRPSTIFAAARSTFRPSRNMPTMNITSPAVEISRPSTHRGCSGTPDASVIEMPANTAPPTIADNPPASSPALV